ncbi:limonene-1,2-epoxide hydrolase family protein [Sphingobium boeckii]|uniref:Limonene-1,2-epoxide hydrolase n=1 Tax=Sphingobium boeckii TaxID=1082345 RepID=A0A7W9EED6_9SPHN|nr:limonene-1,2-epoxide hydrolase family protein [Sphingobium boeckii]MBB5685909.1 limonene-1,2-epoxide hydrolase [Sphingobium boeckii]
MNPIAIIQAFIQAWNQRDRTAIRAALHEDVVCAGIPLPPAYGREAAMALLDPFLLAAEIDWQISAIAGSGNIVMTERRDRFRFPGMGWTEVRAAGIFELDDDGRIIAWRDYFDMAELIAAMPRAAPPS